MNILYVGDVMGEVGLETTESILPKLRREKKIDLVIAQSENVTEGKGITPTDLVRLKKAGVDFCTGGNWSLYREEIIPMLSDPQQPVIRPANYVDGTPGLGWKYVDTTQGRVLIISLLGKIVGRDADKEIDNPLTVIDKVLESHANDPKAATIVNFHGDYSSEKVVIGQYLDGRVTAVIGDHWHVPTADARVLPNGTAHQTDVGMVGALNSSLGVQTDIIVKRWLGGHPSRNILETTGPRQFNAVLVKANSQGLADSIEQIQAII